MDGNRPVRYAVVKSERWNAAGIRLATACAHWRKHGGTEPDWYHLLAAALKLGFPQVTDENVAVVENVLLGYGKARAAEEERKRHRRKTPYRPSSRAVRHITEDPDAEVVDPGLRDVQGAAQDEQRQLDQIEQAMRSLYPRDDTL